ncbi:phosphodiester glycosidase family protein [Sediminibacterium sp. TEGAF015]|uniref:phosphodiester glycosidase family protein n=1 Tax=Sediminibacterium sp. TEGAF015 TaxID=575378 RepID=UPI00220DF97F|nr:phosphodiester glycosidase family protein [Sediminibacterium sp. TEGAF015]BDQ10973.1 hypothetical protein TEGAF0_01900 [Sediminibacterium sp. TEGAF015]
MLRVFLLFFLIPFAGTAQYKWIQADTTFGPLPKGVQLFYSTDSLDGKPNKVFFCKIPITNRQLLFSIKVGNGKRYTPSAYYQDNGQPFLVVNTTFFEFVNNRNLNAVVQDGNLVAYNVHSLPGKGKDTLTYRHAFASAIGISRKRKADIAWLYTDSSNKYPLASQTVIPFFKDSNATVYPSFIQSKYRLKKWKMQTAVAGGPVLIQDGQIQITNNEEIRFPGSQINDKHPRTAMGYTENGDLIVMVVEGRNPGIAEGASLVQLAHLLQSVGCTEALNLDGGGSSTLLINGNETIKPSDKTGQRPVPAVWIISSPKQGQKRPE